jgi:phenylacetate-coenzyme A ligase PaaK-like adenylate-forming protein
MVDRMFSDFTPWPVRSDGYDDHPFTFLRHAEQKDLANIAAIGLIENAGRTARETWQNKQLTNLFRHAHTRSKFWRQRMPSRLVGHNIMSHLPIQSRLDVAAQVELEGSLVANDGRTTVSSYASTGSTGTPVKVFTCTENLYYNTVRSLAQFFFDNLSLTENRVQISPEVSLEKRDKRPVTAAAANSWAGPLSNLFQNGTNKKLVYRHDVDALIAELVRDPIGYLVSPSRYIEILIDHSGIDLFKRLGVKLWLHNSDHRNPEIAKILLDAGIPSLSNYSAGEIGPIAFECSKRQGHFHVAHSNVIIECDNEITASFHGAAVGRLLITHLHSYATPIIRYDIGDFANLHNQCPCGHDGPTISNIYGRGKHFLRHPNGKLLPFYLSTRALLEAVAFKECRIRQLEIDTITVELGGRENITTSEEEKLKGLIIRITDPAFKVEIRPIKEIDWSRNPKRLFFSSSVA